MKQLLRNKLKRHFQIRTRQVKDTLIEWYTPSSDSITGIKILMNILHDSRLLIAIYASSNVLKSCTIIF